MKELKLDPRNKGDFVIKTTLSGWLGRSNYYVLVEVTHRPSGKVCAMGNDSIWESRRSVEKRAVALLEAALELAS